MTNQDIANITAFYGAVIATLVLIWDIFRWYKDNKANITLRIIPNVVLYKQYDSFIRDDAEYVEIKVANKGLRAVRIDRIEFKIYKNYLLKFFDRTIDGSKFAVPKTQPIGIGRESFELPQIIKPGDVWDGYVKKDQLLLDAISSGIAYCCVYDSTNDRYYSERIKLS